MFDINIYAELTNKAILFMPPITWLIYTILEVYSWFIIAAVILSLLIYFNIVNRYQPLVQQIGMFLQRVTEPALKRIRKILPPLGGFDLSPIVLLIIVQFLQRIVIYYF
jgi:YggT family protein